MPKLSKSNVYAILWLNSQNKTIDEIASELNLSVGQVQTHVPNPQEVSENKPNSKNLMITQTSGKGTNSVAIMTKEASEMVDTIKKNHIAPKSTTGIFRPRS